MTSSTWSCEAPRSLAGLGVDCESIKRFEALLARDVYPLPSVFTADEVENARASSRPAWSLCASYCAKEAVAKAICALFDLTMCELLFEGGVGEGELRLAEAFREEHGIATARAVVHGVPGEEGDLFVVAYLFS